MAPLLHHDNIHLRAASGWVELGNPLEASEELHRIPEDIRSHPDVMDVRCQILSLTRNWESLSRYGELLHEMQPESVTGWLYHAEGLHQKGFSQGAKELLLSAWRHDQSADLAYHLARYSCAIGDCSAASLWLNKAFELHGGASLLSKILNDPDLAPLRQELNKL